jgi:hypothetical protein
MTRHLVGLFAAAHLLTVLLGSLGRVDLGIPLWRDAVRVTAPVRRSYGAHFGPKQGWAMFSQVGSTTGRTQVEIRLETGWSPVYIERSPYAAWRRRQFDHYRWREAFLVSSLERHKVLFSQLGEVLVDEALEAHPRATAARVRRLRADMLSPAALRRGERLAFDEVVRVHGRPR